MGSEVGLDTTMEISRIAITFITALVLVVFGLRVCKTPAMERGMRIATSGLILFVSTRLFLQGNALEAHRFGASYYVSLGMMILAGVIWGVSAFMPKREIPSL